MYFLSAYIQPVSKLIQKIKMYIPRAEMKKLFKIPKIIIFRFLHSYFGYIWIEECVIDID